MPTSDTTERDMLENVDMQRNVSVKEFLLGIVNERERKYDQRFDSIDRALIANNVAIKDSLNSANATTKDALNAALLATKDALGAANSATRDALASANSNIASLADSVDKRFVAVNEFRGQLADQQEMFARKTDVDAAMVAFEKAAIKAEAGAEKRFDSVNEFRGQMADLQASFARKTEVDIRVDALDEKLDAAVAQLQQQAGRQSGIGAAGSVIFGVVSLLIAIAAVAISLHGH